MTYWKSCVSPSKNYPEYVLPVFKAIARTVRYAKWSTKLRPSLTGQKEVPPVDIDMLVKAAYQAFWRDTVLEGAWEAERDKSTWYNVARTVLEAAGYDDQTMLLEEAVKHVQDLCAMCRMWRGRFVDWPQCQETCRHGIWLTKAKAALQRAGKVTDGG